MREPPTPAAALQAIRTLSVLDTASVRRLRRRCSNTLRSKPAAYVFAFAASLLAEKTWAARLLGYECIAHHAPACAALNDRRLTALSAGLADWSAVDTFAITLSGPAWREGKLSTLTVRSWASSPDRWLRRLALVTTVRLNTPGGAHGDSKRTLDICRRLLLDRDPMVVKAMSWALRTLAKCNPQDVETFMVIHETNMAALVRREVRNKINFGTKSGRRSE